MTRDGSSAAPVTAFAPATIGNVICGFDVFGMALTTPGDFVTVRRAEGSEVTIRSITGDGGRLPTATDRNSASVAIAALLQATNRTDGLEIDIQKGLPLSGGMGGSAASSVAAVVAADRLLQTDLSRDVLLTCAIAGEGMAAGSAHLDNVAPALFGGLQLVRTGSRRPVISLPVPEEACVALLHPAVELATKEGRAALGDSVSLRDAVAQWGDTAAFVHALHEEDWDLMADALSDRVAEPRRCGSIPGFHAVRAAAVEAGAVACGISGAGPSVFALCRGPDSMRKVGRAMTEAYASAERPPATLHLSPVGSQGARVVSADEVPLVTSTSAEEAVP